LAKFAREIDPPRVPLRVVLDTNIALSLYAFKDSRFAAIRAARHTGHIVFISGTACFQEFERVLGYKQIRLEKVTQAEVAQRYRSEVEWVDNPLSNDLAPLPKCRDKDDQKFLELANHSLAHVLVSADAMVLGVARKPSFAKQFEIITPDKMLERVKTIN
jgi:uncharacterized protein